MESRTAEKYTIHMKGHNLYLRAQHINKWFRLKLDPQAIDENSVPSKTESLVTFTICKGCGGMADKSFSSETEHCDMCVPCEERVAGMR